MYLLDHPCILLKQSTNSISFILYKLSYSTKIGVISKFVKTLGRLKKHMKTELQEFKENMIYR